MDDINDPDNIILYLLPGLSEHDAPNALVTIKHRKNASFRIKHSQQDYFLKVINRTASDCLAIRFTDARTCYGVVCGTALNADLTLTQINSISVHHIAFTFDDRNRPIARDLGSTGGTVITYDGEARDRRSGFDWPLLGPSITKGKPPVLNIGDTIKFRVFIPPRDLASPDYIKRVERFRLGTADPGDLFGALNIHSARRTQLQSGQKSPTRGHGPIIYTKALGEGGFGAVQYHCNLKTGDEYVIKQPLEKHIKHGQYYDQRILGL